MYATEEALKYHLATHDGYQYKCMSCTFKSMTKENLKQHQRGTHGVGLLKARCGEDFSWPHQ